MSAACEQCHIDVDMHDNKFGCVHYTAVEAERWHLKPLLPPANSWHGTSQRNTFMIPQSFPAFVNEFEFEMFLHCGSRNRHCNRPGASTHYFLFRPCRSSLSATNRAISSLQCKTKQMMKHLYDPDLNSHIKIQQFV